MTDYISSAEASDISWLDPKTLSAYRTSRIYRDPQSPLYRGLIEGIHWERINRNRVRYLKKPFENWVANRPNPAEHTKWLKENGYFKN